MFGRIHQWSHLGLDFWFWELFDYWFNFFASNQSVQIFYFMIQSWQVVCSRNWYISSRLSGMQFVGMHCSSWPRMILCNRDVIIDIYFFMPFLTKYSKLCFVAACLTVIVTSWLDQSSCIFFLLRFCNFKRLEGACAFWRVACQFTGLHGVRVVVRVARSGSWDSVWHLWFATLLLLNFWVKMFAWRLWVVFGQYRKY